VTGRPMSLERRIRSQIESKIRSGEWSPGRRLPTEQELVGLYGCARMTVSKAIGGLVAAGLVERRKRAGSFVAHPPAHAAVLEIPDLRVVIEARGETYAWQGLSRRERRLDAANPDEARLGSTGALLALEGLHFAHDAPFALERRVIALAAAPEAADTDFAQESPGTWLLKKIPWTEAEHLISAVRPRSLEAKRLAIPGSTACLRVKRWTWRQGHGVTFVEQIFPGPAYDLVARFGHDAASVLHVRFEPEGAADGVGLSAGRVVVRPETR
jgi:GntR family histidine utilization transcriptional repressor